MAQHKNKGRRYSAEEKAAAVRMVRTLRAELGTSQGTTSRVAEQLGYGVESVRSWVRQADIDAGEREGHTSTELAEIKRLKAENKRLREDVAVLKAATTFFAGELDPRNR